MEKKNINNSQYEDNNKTKTLEIIYFVWNHIKLKRKLQFIALLLLMIISGILEINILKYIIPLVRNFVNLENTTSTIIKFSLFILISTIIRLLTIWFNEKYTAIIGNDISSKAFSIAIRIPYSEQIDRNSSDLIAIMLKYIDDTTQVLKHLIRSIYFIIYSISLSIGLFLINFKITFAIIFAISFIYLILIFYSKNNLILNGKKITFSYKVQAKLVQESLGSIKDLIINKSFNIYESNFLKTDIVKRRSLAINNFISAYPKIVLEGLGIISVLIIIYFLNYFNPNKIGQTLGLISAFALGFQKLLPAVQSLYLSISRFRSEKESVLKVMGLFKYKTSNIIKNKTKNLQFEFKKIELKDIFFKYKKSNNWIIESLNLTIKKGEKIGIIGSTGSGKSTLIDIITGLLKPNKGLIHLNGIPLKDNIFNEKIAELQDIISYVPQNIFITDASVEENIAFGITSKFINKTKVIQSAKKARIHNFIKTKPEEYKTKLGERGINLSGGQIQRIGIARALYKEPKFIIFDEASSALDSNTEKKVLDSIYSLKEDITIIMIAHRLNTIINCDRVIELENGKIKSILNKKQILEKINNEANA